MKLNVPTPISQAVAAIAGVLAGLALGAAIVATIATLFLGYRVVSVNSGSMEPAIKKADIVVIRGADLAKVKENDVIFYQERNTRLSFVHRVIAVRVQDLKVQDRTTGDILSQQFVYEFVTQGDANLGPDPETVRGIEDFGGKVWFKVPTFGLFPTGISPRIMLFAVAGLFAVLWFIWEGLNRGNRSKPPSRGKKRARASARPTRSTTRAGSVDIRRLRPAKPGPLSRLGSWLIDQADDLLYGLTRLWRRVGRSIAAQRRLASRHVRVPRGAGLWVLAPLAVWAGAIAVLAGVFRLCGQRIRPTMDHATRTRRHFGRARRFAHPRLWRSQRPAMRAREHDSRRPRAAWRALNASRLHAPAPVPRLVQRDRAPGFTDGGPAIDYGPDSRPAESRPAPGDGDTVAFRFSDGDAFAARGRARTREHALCPGDRSIRTPSIAFARRISISIALGDCDGSLQRD